MNNPFDRRKISLDNTFEYQNKFCDVRVKNLYANQHKFSTPPIFKTLGSGLSGGGPCVTAANGCVYVCPYNSISFYKYNPATGLVTTYYTSGVTNVMCYSACTSFDNRYVYFFPSVFSSNSNTFKIDTTNDSVSVIAFSGPGGFTSIGGSNAISGCYLEPTGRYIYMMPNTANMWLKFDTVSEVFTSIYSYGSSAPRYNAICRTANANELLLVPFTTAASWQKVDTTTDVVTTFGASAPANAYGVANGYLNKLIYYTTNGIIYEVNTTSLAIKQYSALDATTYRAPILLLDGYTVMFPPASSNRFMYFDTRTKKIWYNTPLTGSFAARFTGSCMLANGDVVMSNGQATTLGLLSFRSKPKASKKNYLNRERNRY
jgi:hypothetical protein